MSTIDVMDVAGMSGSGAPHRAPAFSCEASDLKQIMQHIADQIADADKRHSTTLAAMQDRLSALGAAANGLRDHVPGDMAPVISRIEGSMAELAQRIGEADQQRRLSADAAPAELAPAALRSALVTDAVNSLTQRAETARAGGKPPVDHFDVVDSDGTATDDEPWDKASAEALARLYETGEARLAAMGDGSVPATSMPVAMAQSTVTVQSPPAGPTAGNAMAIEIERSWLEQRFSDVAAKLEVSLANLRPDGSVAELNTRFARLEDSIAKTMSDAVTRADLAGLKTIETQVEDLTAQLDTVQTHFSRLDTIELELRALAERITEEKLAKLFEQNAPKAADNEALAGMVGNKLNEQMPRIEQALRTIAERVSAEKLVSVLGKSVAVQPDAGSIAKLVADQVAQHVTEHVGQHFNQQQGASSTTPDASIERLDDLRDMIERFVSEQRHGDEQTNTMLDTMQQAMIRLLDRMDAMEAGQVVEPEYADSYEHATGPEHRDHAVLGGADYEQPQTPHGEHGRRRSDEPTTYAEDQRDAPPRDAQQSDATWTRGAGVREESYASQSATAGHGHFEEPVASTNRVNAAPGRADDQSGAVNREDYIASARRAARAAAAAPAAEPANADEAEQATAAPLRKPRASTASSGGRSMSRLSMALICLIAVGAGFTVVKSTILATPPVAKVETRAPAPVPAKRGLQNLEDADVIIEDGQRSGQERNGQERGGKDSVPGATQRRSSGPSSMGGEATEYANMLDGAQNDAIPAARALAQSGGNPGMSEFMRQHVAVASSNSQMGLPGAPAIPAALPSGAQGSSLNARPANEMPPLTIGPNSLRTAAANGDASAEFEIAARFAEGKGVTQDLKQAVVWYQRSAAQGFAAAQYRLASMYERGFGVKTDLARARVWYERAAEQGVVKAMHNLAVLSAGRDSGAPDYTTAAKWFAAAANHGLTDSQFNLAIMRDSGLGMDRDAKQAYKWFSLAAKAGDDEASRRRDSLKSKLMPQEVQEIEAELASWRAKTIDNAVNDPRVAGEAWKQRAR